MRAIRFVGFLVLGAFLGVLLVYAGLFTLIAGTAFGLPRPGDWIPASGFNLGALLLFGVAYFGAWRLVYSPARPGATDSRPTGVPM